MSRDDNGDMTLHCKIGHGESRLMGTFRMTVLCMQKLRNKRHSYLY
jgi:hypothetical protein